ncbi:hypothetical protein SESBI_02783 [Sesbania bispinosa]|nr:hypothetical protein SESBI_02783 [Sesbania bispinosa]
MDWSWAFISDSDGLGGLEREDALTNLEKKEEEEARAEPGLGTSSFDAAEDEKPRPCLNLAAPSPFRVHLGLPSNWNMNLGLGLTFTLKWNYAEEPLACFPTIIQPLWKTVALQPPGIDVASGASPAGVL